MNHLAVNSFYPFNLHITQHLLIEKMPFGFHLQGPRITHHHKRRTVIPGFLYVTFFGLKPKFSVQFGNHVHIN
ncbi:hypothetical protein BJ912DRAFT_963680, partial [Pholiota molesta]